jgi:RpiR family carbohydrate utilization transcriptional regulator
MNTFLSLIERQAADCSKAELKVAQFVLSDARLVLRMSIAELARHVGVSEPTVIRFCRRLGYSGFRGFKDELLAQSGNMDSVLHQTITENDPVSEAVSKVLESCTRTLLDVSHLARSLPFEPAAAMLTKAKQIVFAGLGASGFVAQDAQHKFFRLGIPCRTALDTPTILQSAAIAQPGEVFIFISQTGEWPELVNALDRCRAQGVSTLAFTRRGSELAARADLVFDCEVGENTHVYTPMNSRLATLALLDALQVSLAILMGQPAEANLRETKTVLNDHLKERAQPARRLGSRPA